MPRRSTRAAATTTSGSLRECALGDVGEGDRSFRGTCFINGVHSKSKSCFFEKRAAHVPFHPSTHLGESSISRF